MFVLLKKTHRICFSPEVQVGFPGSMLEVQRALRTPCVLQVKHAVEPARLHSMEQFLLHFHRRKTQQNWLRRSFIYTAGGIHHRWASKHFFCSGGLLLLRFHQSQDCSSYKMIHLLCSWISKDNSSLSQKGYQISMSNKWVTEFRGECWA